MSDVAGLRAQLEQYKQTQQWEKAIETVLQLLDQEHDPVRKAELATEAAQISREQLLDPDNAVEYLDYAVDAYFIDPDVLDDAMLSSAINTFRVMESILTERRQWRNLDRAVRKMLVRLEGAGSRFDRLHAEMSRELDELRGRVDFLRESVPATAKTSPVPDAGSDAPSWSDDPRMNDPIGLGLGPPDDASAPAKPADIGLLKEQLGHEYYSLRFQAWDGLMAAFGLEAVVRAPAGQRGKGSVMELLKDFLASDCKALVRIGAEDIRAIVDKLASGATAASLGIEWQPDAAPSVTERMLQAMFDPQLAYPVEEIAMLTGLPRRWAETSLALGVEKNDPRAIDALVQLNATWTLPALEELAQSPKMTAEIREKLASAVRYLKLTASFDGDRLN